MTKQELEGKIKNLEMRKMFKEKDISTFNSYIDTVKEEIKSMDSEINVLENLLDKLANMALDADVDEDDHDMDDDSGGVMDTEANQITE